MAQAQYKNVAEHLANAERQLKEAELVKEGKQAELEMVLARAESDGGSEGEHLALERSIEEVAEWTDELDYWAVQLELIQELDERERSN